MSMNEERENEERENEESAAVQGGAASEGTPEAEVAAAPVADEPEAVSAGAGGPAAVAEPVRSGGPRILLTAAVSAGVLVFALAFFMAGFAAHALLDDDSDGGAAGGTSSAATADDPSWGPEDAPVVIQEFADFQCPYCAKFAEETLSKVRDTYGDKVHFIFRDFPLTNIHQMAMPAAVAAGCANDQGLFWEYHDILYQNQASLSQDALVDYAEQAGLDAAEFQDCVASGKKTVEIMLDSQDAKADGVTGTPAFVINGMLISGAQPFEVFQSVIDPLLAAE